MPIEFHPQASQRFNERGVELRKLLRQIERVTLDPPDEPFRPESVPAATFTEADIVDFAHMGDVNRLTGDLQRLLFDDGTRCYELDRDGCIEFNRLTAAIAKAPGFGGRVSVERVEQEVRDWLDPHRREEAPLVDRLISAIEPSIKRYSAWVPVAYLHVQSDLPFGDVTFVPITSRMMDAWQAACLPTSPEEAPRIETFFLRLRQKSQGLAAVILEIEAEEMRALQIAADTAERAVALLRTFCVENLHPAACSYCVPQGRLAAIGDHIWLSPGGPTLAVHRSILPPPPNDWLIADTHRGALAEMGFDALSEVARTAGVSEFDEKLVEALLIYNRANVARDPVDKLIYVLVALESLLLKNQSEPIQAAIGDRLAFVLGKNVEERMEIAALVRECYAIRSRYVHHGQSKEALDVLERFLRYAWVFFTRLIRGHKEFASKDALLQWLERRKYQ